MQKLTEEQKQAKREYNQKRYHERKDLESEKKRRAEYYRDNSEHVIEKVRKLYNNDINSSREKRRQWQIRCKEKSKTDVDQTFRVLLSGVKSRSRAINRKCDIDLAYLHQLWSEQNGLCKLSGLPMSSEIGSKWKKVSPDRINSKLGYIKGNIQLVLASVNTFKMDMEQDEFISICIAIADQHRANCVP